MDLLNHLPELFQVLFLAVLQGVTELFPVSSLGQSIIIPGVLGWGNLLTSETFLPILVMLHLGTATALLIFFWRDWVELITAFFKTTFAGRLDAHPQGKTIWLLIIGTIPVGLAGVFLETPIKTVFFSSQWPVIPAAFLCLNGAILFVGEQLRRRSEPAVVDRAKQEQTFKRIPQLSFLQATLIGAAQAFALIPGISRSGIAMVAGMGARLSHAEAARFSFLLATPVILLAGLKEVPILFDPTKTTSTTLVIAIIGAVVSGIAAYLSVRFLTRYFEVGRLTPFAVFCLVEGLVAFLIFAPISLGLFTLPW
jgi:undecaprenyl-diphosphatase